MCKMIHKFEDRGMGKGPYRFVGFWEMPSASLAAQNASAYNTAMRDSPKPKGGIGSCNYCGTGISNHFLVEDAEGVLWAVGSSCINKSGDAGLIKFVKKEIKERRREQAANREKINGEKFRGLLRDALTDSAIEKLKAKPHPHAYYASQGKTRWDYFAFCYLNDKQEVGERMSSRSAKQALYIIENLD